MAEGKVETEIKRDEIPQNDGILGKEVEMQGRLLMPDRSVDHHHFKRCRIEEMKMKVIRGFQS